jgi:hypothetical protein
MLCQSFSGCSVSKFNDQFETSTAVQDLRLQRVVRTHCVAPHIGPRRDIVCLDLLVHDADDGWQVFNSAVIHIPANARCREGNYQQRFAYCECKPAAT